MHGPRQPKPIFAAEPSATLRDQRGAEIHELTRGRRSCTLGPSAIARQNHPLPRMPVPWRPPTRPCWTAQIVRTKITPAKPEFRRCERPDQNMTTRVRRPCACNPHQPTVFPLRKTVRQRSKVHLAFVARSLAWSVSARRVMRIISNLRNLEHSDAKSAMNSPCRCAVNIIATCTAMATKSRGGQTFRLHRSRPHTSFGKPPWLHPTDRSPVKVRTIKLINRPISPDANQNK